MAAAQAPISLTSGTRGARLAPVLRWALVLMYAWAAGGKFFWPQQARAILRDTGMIPAHILDPLAYGMPSLELVLAVSLAAKVLLPAALVLSLFISTVYGGVHGYLLISGELVPCGCAGVAIDFSSWEWHVFLLGLSVAMALASVALLFSLPVRKVTERAAAAR